MSVHFEGPVCCEFQPVPSAMYPAYLFYTSLLLSTGFAQLFSKWEKSNQDGYQVGTIDTLYSVLSLTLIDESHL